MNAHRVELLRKRLTDRLDNEVIGDSEYKMLWLVRHLEEYLERWFGFAELEGVTVADTLHNELFDVVLAAVDVINSRLPQLGPTKPFPREEWQHFQNALEWIQKSPERSELALITSTFDSFCSKFPV